MRSSLLQMMNLYAQRRESLSDELAMAVLESSDDEFEEILKITAALAQQLRGDRISLCGILNIKSGRCSEDCAFCAQSAHHGNASDAASCDLLGAKEILAARDKYAKRQLDRFSLVASGLRLDDRQLQELCRALIMRSEGRPAWCASLGCLELPQLQMLRAAGVVRYHHNIETAESFYPQICTTHSYGDRVATVRAARAAGLQVCSGGIFGLGESLAQRVEFARALARLEVESVALNFLLPLESTPMADMKKLTASEILRAIAMVRLVAPRAELRIAAGRKLLGYYQRQIFAAGATGMITGELLTTTGSNLEMDLELLASLGLSSS